MQINLICKFSLYLYLAICVFQRKYCKDTLRCTKILDLYMYMLNAIIIYHTYNSSRHGAANYCCLIKLTEIRILCDNNAC